MKAYYSKICSTGSLVAYEKLNTPEEVAVGRFSGLLRFHRVMFRILLFAALLPVSAADAADLIVGREAGAANEAAGTRWKEVSSADNVIVGQGERTSGNRLQIVMHAALKAAGTVVGQGRYADGNQITVDTGGRLETGSLEIGYGYGANGNRVNVWPGGVLIAEEVCIGRTGNSGNALLLYRDADLTVGMINLASKNSIGFQSPGTLDFALLSDWLSAGRVPLYVNGTRVTADNMKRLLCISFSGDITFFTAAPFIFTHMTEIIAVAAAVLLAGAVICGLLWYRRRRAAGEERRWRKETWLSNWYEDCQRRKRQQQRRSLDRREE